MTSAVFSHETNYNHQTKEELTAANCVIQRSTIHESISLDKEKVKDTLFLLSDAVSLNEKSNFR